MASVFESFFQGGFECSCHQWPDGRQLDLLESTGHAWHAESDFRALQEHGIRTVRDGLRWHVIESTPQQYDWRSFLPLLHAAQRTGMQVIWDLCHYGWPAHLDIWSAEFPEQFARYAAAAARVVASETDGIPFYCPVNEISYWSWAGGEVGHFGPLAFGRGVEFKRQLVRASIAAMAAIREVDRRARFVLVDPCIHVAPRVPEEIEAAALLTHSQFDGWDMLRGTLMPELGGAPEYLDIVGANYYPHNQWFLEGPRIERGDPAHRPLHELLGELARRYERPILLAETGAEDEARSHWLRHVGDEAALALSHGVALEGICLYPITDYPGWGDDRHCATGLLGIADSGGQRCAYSPLAEEVRRQQLRFEQHDATHLGRVAVSSCV